MQECKSQTTLIDQFDFVTFRSALLQLRRFFASIQFAILLYVVTFASLWGAAADVVTAMR